MGHATLPKTLRNWLVTALQDFPHPVTIQQKIRGTPPPRNRWGRKAGESIPLDAVETHIFLGYT
ncbi:MAG: hypothetical protein GVY04_23280 [Cyanobacteria bacterium]|jgi:hypothetical protein|nr:hypothetical protein [Cyanobacteria bacterium GSL.Bin1]